MRHSQIFTLKANEFFLSASALARASSSYIFFLGGYPTPDLLDSSDISVLLVRIVRITMQTGFDLNPRSYGLRGHSFPLFTNLFLGSLEYLQLPS